MNIHNSEQRAEWNFDKTLLILRFPYEVVLKNKVKALGAHFDWNTKTWRFFKTKALIILPQLLEYGFSVPEISDTRPTKKVLSPAKRASQQQTKVLRTKKILPPNSYSISEINQEISASLNSLFPNAFWIVGKIVGARKIRVNQHAYIELVEENINGAPLARLSTIIFRNTLHNVVSKLAQRNLTLEEGLQVRLYGRISFYVARGTFSFIVDEIDPAFSEGVLVLKREEIMRILREKNLAQKNLSLAIPILPLRIALLTSKDSDAYYDILNTLKESGYSFIIHLFDVRVQGADLRRTVTFALEQVAKHRDYFDLCLISRGGGSRVELSSWDDLKVAAYVASLPVKTIIGIGHEQDQSVLDQIAISQKTPTAAAQWIVSKIDEVSLLLQNKTDKLQEISTNHLEQERALLLQQGEAILNATTRTTSHTQRLLDRLSERLLAQTNFRLQREQSFLEQTSYQFLRLGKKRNFEEKREKLSLLATKLIRKTQPLLEQNQQILSETQQKLTDSVQKTLTDQKHKLQHLDRYIRLSDPKNIMRRGFSFIRDNNGAVISTRSELHNGDSVQLELLDGSVSATIGDSL